MKEDLSSVKNLVLVGNGFDIWQGLPTKMSDFKKYYRENKERIAKQLHIKPVVFTLENGYVYKLNYIEMFYWFLKKKNYLKFCTEKYAGENAKYYEVDEFLDKKFWFDFENNLFNLDDIIINTYYGKTKKDLKMMQLGIRDLKKLLRELFCQWIMSINVEPKQCEYNFKDCLFINFNYTNTLRARFGVSDIRDYHIHGIASKKKSIIFGHSNHQNDILITLRKTVGRLKGLAQIAMAQFKMNKLCEVQIAKLLNFHLKYDSIMADIQNIYVAGLSCGKADFDYLQTFADAYPKAKWHISYFSEEDKTRITKVMQKLKVTNYELKDSIPKVLKRFKKSKT